MSYIGESRAFRREADRIRHRLATEDLLPEERALLWAQARELDIEAESAWEMARADCCEDESDRYASFPYKEPFDGGE